ncbi:hypothetical protein [Pseudomonas sp. MYb185]|uniref:hypothetical protein n=1 Tax=Pseudomonas sp. MYb185 TaxID=1848729 RepID=UPI0011B01F17|nr:hypothetical protein [Pseudomonas sp. MYb185]
MQQSRLISTAVVVVSIAGMVLLGLLIVYIGSRLAGGLDAYGQLLLSAWPTLLVWRLALYVLLTVLWVGRLRQQVVRWLRQDEDGGVEGYARLRRLEWAALAFVVLLEIYNLNAAWGQA